MPEPIERSTASELDGLPDVDRKETEDIIEEIAKEEGKQEGDAPDKKETEKEPEPKKDDEPADKKQEEKDGKGKEDPDLKDGKDSKDKTTGKTPKFIPSWVHERAKDGYEKTIAGLKTALEDASKEKGPSSEKKDTDPEQQAALEEDVKRIAEEHKLDAKLVKSLVDLGMKYGGKLPADIQEKLKEVDNLRATAEVQAEESAFNASFDKDVLPLIKAEYGDLDADTIEVIRNKVMEKAYSEEYGKTPITVLFKGLDEFRSFKRTTKKSAEPSRGGQERAGDTAPEGDDSEFENVTEEDIDKMDSATFDRYTAFAEKKETGRVRSS